jgi:hypothetical protein
MGTVSVQLPEPLFQNYDLKIILDLNSGVYDSSKIAAELSLLASSSWRFNELLAEINRSFQVGGPSISSILITDLDLGGALDASAISFKVGLTLQINLDPKLLSVDNLTGRTLTGLR